jgi:hypothetical protein
MTMQHSTPKERIKAIESAIVAEMNIGISATEIRRRYIIPKLTVERIAKRNDVTLVDGRKLSNFRHKADYARLFDTSEEADYWLGFIAADGCVQMPKHLRRTSTLRISLAEKDREHVAKFKEFMRSSHSIGISITKCREYNWAPKHYITMASDLLCNSLIDLGIKPNKTFGMKVVPRLASSRHFWRGVMDGDGSFGERRAVRSNGLPILFLSIVGDQKFMRQFQEFLNSHGMSSGVYKHGSIFCVSHSGRRKITKILRLLYGDCVVALSRKQLNAEKIIIKHGTLGDIEAPTASPTAGS